MFHPWGNVLGRKIDWFGVQMREELARIRPKYEWIFLVAEKTSKCLEGGRLIWERTKRERYLAQRFVVLNDRSSFLCCSRECPQRTLFYVRDKEKSTRNGSPLATVGIALHDMNMLGTN